MRILWLTKKRLDVAADRTTWVEAVKHLSACGDDVHLVAGYQEGPQDLGLGSSLHYIRAVRSAYLYHLSAMVALAVQAARLLGRQRGEVVLFDPWTAPAVVPSMVRRALARRRQPAFVCDFRTLPVGYVGWRASLEDAVFRTGMVVAGRADGATFITEAMRAAIVRDYPRMGSLRAETWSSGVDLEHFDSEALVPGSVAELRARLGLSDRFVIMYHGAINVTRGLLELVEAVKLVVAGGHREIALVLVGGGAGIPAVQAAVRASHLEAWVQIVGPIDYVDVPRYIAACDIGVVPLPDSPGWRVSSPLKMLEYLAMKKCVVATDIVAHRSVVGESPCAFLVRDSSPRSLADGLLAAVETGREALCSRGAVGREIVDPAFSWATQVGRLRGLLSRVSS